MLQAIRDRAQGWIAWAIVILISIPFALWGIADYLGVGAEPVVATVNGDEIKERALDQRYQQVRRSLQERLGANFRPEMFDEQRMRQQVLDSMIDELVIQQASRDLGLYAGDALVREAIRSVPAFQKDGQFDQAAYQRALQLQGYPSPVEFEERLRNSLVTGQLEVAVRETEFATRRELEELARLRKQTRQFSYLRVPAREFRSEEAIPEQDVQAYYDEHLEQFRSPEQVKLQYLVVDTRTVRELVSPDEDQLREYFEAHAGDYVQPEKRRASHILVSLDRDADAEQQRAALQKIEAARERILAGEDFSAVAKELSEDPGSAANGGELGFFGAGEMDPAFEQAAFAAAEGEVTEPVRSDFGYHLVLVREIQPEVAPGFEEVREQVERAVSQQEAERLLADYAERLHTLTYEHPDSLEPAAEELGLEIQTSDWMGRSGGKDLLAYREVVEAAFSEDVLGQGNNSELIELGPDQMLVLRVAEHQQAAVKPLDEVRDQVVERVRREQAREAARAEAEALLSRLEAGATLEELAEESGFDLKQPDSLERTSDAAPRRLVTEVFKLPRPSGEAPTSSLVALANGDYAVVALTEVSDGAVQDLGEAARTEEKAALRRSLGQEYYQHLVQSLRSEADIKIPEQ
jgi:peptidyl-prolyl cis-trans isomerase D